MEDERIHPEVGEPADNPEKDQRQEPAVGEQRDERTERKGCGHRGDEKRTEDKGAKGWFARHSDGIQAAMAIMVTLFTAILTVTSIAQWNQMEASNEISRRAMISQSRAWVLLSTEDISVELPIAFREDPPLLPPIGSKVRVRFMNSGALPARRVAPCLRTYVRQYPPRQALWNTRCDRRTVGQGSVGIVAPGQPAYYATEIVEEFTQGTWLYLVGKVTYENGFGGTGVTRFCMYFVPEEKPGAYRWNFCPRFNKAR